MTRWLALPTLALVSALSIACGSKEAPGPDPQMMSKLNTCSEQLQKSQGETQICQKQLADLQNTSKDTEVVIRIEGNTITLVGTGQGGPNQRNGGSSADDAKLY